MPPRSPCGLPWCATVVALALLPSLAAAQAANEEPLRGDFAPRIPDLNDLLERELSDAEAARMFRELFTLLEQRVGSDVVSQSDLYLGAMHGMMDAVNARHDRNAGPLERALPDKAMLLDEPQAAQLRRDLAGEMTGIGIDFRLFPDPGLLLVMDVLPGSPGDRAGMRPGDRILAVDRIGFAGAGVPQVLGLLQGEAGSTLTLHVLRGDGLEATALSVEVARAVFPVHSTQAELTPNGVGWIHLSQIHSGSPAEVEEGVQRLRKLGAADFVLDLRQCQGGDLPAAVAIADLFLPRSAVIVRLNEPGVGERDLTARREQVVGERLVVLVNRWTQGVAEALAVALQEHARAYVIGEPTMGSAQVETLVSLGHGLVARLNTVRLESPTGASWQGIGVQPDQRVLTTGTGAPGETGEQPTHQDHQFQNAVHYLQSEGE